MPVMMRLVIACLMLTWVNVVQAEDMRFQIELSFEDAGVSPSISAQVQQALPQLWQRIIPQSEQADLHGLQAMSFLKSIRPHGLTSSITFNEQRVWQALDARSIVYIRPLPSFYMTLDILNALGHHNTRMESELQIYLNELSQTWGIQRSDHGPLLALNVQWLNDVQFYISAVQQGKTTQRDQNHWTQGVDAMQQLKASLQRLLLHVRSQYVVQAVADSSQNIEPIAIETQTFHLLVEGQASLANQVLLETALQSDTRVESITPLLLEPSNQTYLMVVKKAPELWLETWFLQRGMTASLGLEGWLAQ
ncbi:MAG: hypothetical protein COA61_006550 [Zetaproteobacteria bacterium]|nr:hypothetical protein [Zetaproteobacteria bacterium]